jgi:TolA-binding protein
MTDPTPAALDGLYERAKSDVALYPTFTVTLAQAWPSLSQQFRDLQAKVAELTAEKDALDKFRLHNLARAEQAESRAAAIRAETVEAAAELADATAAANKGSTAHQKGVRFGAKIVAEAIRALNPDRKGGEG